MSLIKCPKCSSQISDKATACPKCGNPMAPAVLGDVGMGESQLMDKYGISYDGERYTYEDNCYTKFSDALAYAKYQPKQASLAHVANSTSSELSVSVLGGSGWPLRQGQIYGLSVGQRVSPTAV